MEAYPPGRVPPVGPVGGGGINMSTGQSLNAAPPMKHQDVEVSCLTWGQAVNPGNNVDTHGYVEFRFFIDNHSADDHRVTLTLPRRSGGSSNGLYVSALRRSVEVKAGASMQVSLFQPDLPIMYVGGGAEVEIDGRPAQNPVPINASFNRGARTGGMFTPGTSPSPTMPTAPITRSSVEATAAGLAPMAAEMAGCGR